MRGRQKARFLYHLGMLPGMFGIALSVLVAIAAYGVRAHAEEAKQAQQVARAAEAATRATFKLQEGETLVRRSDTTATLRRRDVDAVEFTCSCAGSGVCTLKIEMESVFCVPDGKRGCRSAGKSDACDLKTKTRSHAPGKDITLD
jgi:hypothetical protein